MGDVTNGIGAQVEKTEQVMCSLKKIYAADFTNVGLLHIKQY